jgi:hypothetical protein
MQVRPILDACGDKETKTEKIGNMQCNFYSYSKSYECWFGVDVKNQKIVNAVVF